MAVANPKRARRTSFSTQRPVAITMLFVAAAVFGFFSLAKLPVNLMPELTYPTITVRTEYEGAAPEEVENDISRPIEEALGVIGGLQQVSSVSRAGVSDVVLEFDWNVDISDATQSVLEKLDLVFLPDEAERPLILHFDPSLDPVMELSLSGEGAGWEGESGLRRARRLAEIFLKRQLEPVSGVAAVRVKGGLEEEIHIELDEAQLRRTRISIQQVIDRVAQENINVAGGTIEEGRTEFLVRTLNEYGDLDQIRETIVAVIGDRPVRVDDLGSVSMAHKERQILTRTDGNESVQIEIYKEADANIVDLAQRVKALVGEVDRDRESDTEGRGRRSAGGLAQQVYDEEGALLKVVADRSLFIESSINEVRSTAILGGLLAVIVLFLFLREGRSTSIVAVSIPLSLIMAFAPMNLFGVSLNIMSLGGLALGIGMLVDSSIVVLESIFRCREEGDDVVTAAVRGTREVQGAVVASTLTTIAVFFPMVFVEGVAGQAFGDLGTAVVVSLIASLLVAVWFIPMLASRGGLALETSTASGRPRLLHFDMGKRLKRSFTENRVWKRVLFAPWWIIRFVVEFVLHYTVGVVFMLLVLLIAALVRGIFFTKIGRLVVGALFLLLFAVMVNRVAEVPLPIAAGLAVLVAVFVAFRGVDRVMGGLDAAYPRILKGALDQPLGTLVIVALCMWGTYTLVLGLDSELLPEVRQGEFTVEVQLPVGTPLRETEQRLRSIEDALVAEVEHVRAIVVTYGFDPAQSERSDEGEHTARFKVLLETGSGAEIEDLVVERVRRRFEGLPDIAATITRPVLFSSKTPIEVEVHGDDLVALRGRTEEVRGLLHELPELADVQATLRAGAPELQVVYDRERLMRYGLNLGGVARLVRDKVQGNEATRFNRTDRRIPVVVQLRESDRASVDDVEEVVVNPGGERPIRLEAVASVVMGEGPSEVRRIDGQRVGLVRANIEQGSLGSAVEAIRSTLFKDVEWPEDETFFISGQSEEWERSQSSLVLALGLSIFLVYVIMAIQFESLVHPLVILFSIPLAFLGSAVALQVLGIPLSVVVFLGMIMLAGIVVNNAIVLVDYVNQLRRRGMPKREAVVTAGRVRLRPIFMTTATTVLGLLPMAVGLGDGAELRTPMAITVIAGLISSTVLTLIVVPVLYSLFDRLAPVTADVPSDVGPDEGSARTTRGGSSGSTPGSTPGEVMP